MRDGLPEKGLLPVNLQIGFGDVIRHQNFEQKKRDLPNRPSLVAIPEPARKLAYFGGLLIAR
jgi:hypothetical protein